MTIRTNLILLSHIKSSLFHFFNKRVTLPRQCLKRIYNAPSKRIAALQADKSGMLRSLKAHKSKIQSFADFPSSHCLI